MKSCTLTRLGLPYGLTSVPPYLSLAISSFVFVSIEMTGCPGACAASTVALVCSNCAFRSGCLEPSSALRLCWRGKAELDEFLAHRVGADQMTHSSQGIGEFVHALLHPEQRAPGIAERGRFEELFEGRDKGWILGDGRFAPRSSTAHRPPGPRHVVEFIFPPIDPGSSLGPHGAIRSLERRSQGRPIRPSALRRQRTCDVHVRPASSRSYPSDSGWQPHRSCHPGYTCLLDPGIPQLPSQTVARSRSAIQLLCAAILDAIQVRACCCLD